MLAVVGRVVWKTLVTLPDNNYKNHYQESSLLKRSTYLPSTDCLGHYSRVVHSFVTRIDLEELPEPLFIRHHF
jgi:hypothetical protein